ncbi:MULTISPECIES: aminopeptidase [unclassified Micromonospora]|uniref:aminopeptidase n=1 Tax=unclassified Micromonospora TaxID=2617518 RepID=UPI0022B601E4|nr:MULTISPECIES: aminopeptidase [unclassified Micromonospora]MCZ7477143.1 aminopeptidase [Micromonospora sp. WMMC273]WBC01923.1 aminopeptidase [Micromonospora sp. WMMA1976]
MRLSSGLRVAAVVAGLLSVGAALLAMREASLLWAVVTLAALAGHALAASGTPRVRWGVAAGAGLFALVAAANLLWHRERVADAGGPRGSQAATRTYLVESLREGLDQQRLTAWGLALGVLLLSVAVPALPARGGRRGVVTTVLAVAVLVWCGLKVAAAPGDPPLPELLLALQPALLAALVTAGVLAWSGWRGDRRGLLTAGMVLLAVVAVRACADLASAWASWWTFVEPARDAFLQPGFMVSVGGSAGGALEVSSAVETAVALGGAGLAVVGVLRASRENARP